MTDERLQLLLDRYFSGLLSLKEKGELEAILAGDPESRQEFWMSARVHAALRQWGAGQSGLRHLEAANYQSDLEVECRPTPLPEAHNSERNSSRRHRPRLRWIAAAAVLLCAVLIGLPGWLGPSGPSVPNEVGSIPEFPSTSQGNFLAVVLHAVDAYRDGNAIGSTESGVEPGAFSIDSGQITLRFLSGVLLTVDGPARLELASDMEVRVLAGRVRAKVPQSAHGFTLAARDFRVVDHGTEFGVSVDSAGASEVHVFDGKVEVHNIGKLKEGRQLVSGEAVRLEESGQLAGIPAVTEDFVSDEELAVQVLQLQTERFAAWKMSTKQFAKSGDLLLHFDFEHIEHDAGLVLNLQEKAPSRSHGVLVGANWTEGRWPGKSAVAFQRPGDLLSCNPGGWHKNVSMLAWVRIDALQEDYNTILLSPNKFGSQFYWLVNGERFLFAKNRVRGLDSSRQGEQNEHLLSASVLPPQRLGQWMHVALVHDSETGTLRHYLNGRCVGNLQYQYAQGPLDLNRCIVGNWGNSTRDRNLVGRMDELAIFTRALTDEEIAQHYKAGTP